MHHLKGLVRRVCHPLVKQLEADCTSTSAHVAYECVRDVVLIDACGERVPERVIEVPKLLKLLEDSPPDSTSTFLKEINELSGVKPTLRDDLPVLYVKGTAGGASKELQLRQQTVLARLEGKLRLTACTRISQESVETLVSDFSSEPAPRSVPLLRGLMHALCTSHPDIALAATLSGGPANAFQCGAALALAKATHMDKEDDVEALLGKFEASDTMLPASQTGATHFISRLAADAESSRLSSVLSLCHRYRVDPAVVFPTNASAVQKWASLFLPSDALPMERRAIILDLVSRRRLLPRRLSLNALSAWCGSDLERDWVLSAVGDVTAAQGDDLSDEVYRKASLTLLLKDPQRNLVDHQLLHQYSYFLDRGEFSPHSTSFASFVDECGECHEPSQRPQTLSFTMKAPPAGQSIRTALKALAPASAFWSSLLLSTSSFQLWTAPYNEVRVQVMLPTQHECVTAARCSLSTSTAPIFSTLYEDDDVLIIDKPAGVATTRHCLAGTQGQDPHLTDVLSLIIEQPAYRPLTSLLRQGLVHRLDADTSGCLLIAKSNEAVASLRHQFGSSGAFSLFNKRYVCICVVLEEDLRRVSLTGLTRDPQDPKIVTKYRILRFFPKQRMALVECSLQQGKKHQIRRHLATAGLPLAADVVHGGASCIQPFIQRTALHAASLSFMHPRSAETICVLAPLPYDFRHAIDALESLNSRRPNGARAISEGSSGRKQ